MPTIPEIKISIENKNLFIKDAFIKEGVFLRGQNGKLIMYTGGFTAVFPVVVNGETWAYRCWHTNIGNTTKRFQEIASCVQSSQAQYLCDFAYVPNGIVVDGKVYPTTRMKWIEGQTIKEYICANAHRKDKLQKLANDFLLLVQDMHKRGYSHGDLQHGNILIDKKENLYLVDYDSFFCPALQGEKDIIKGLADYQHPARGNNHFANEKLDYFSELIIYTSILAIAERPDFVSKYQVADSERMLFSKNDYKDIQKSAIYKELVSLSNKNVSNLLGVLVEYLKHKDINELKPFDTLCGFDFEDTHIAPVQHPPVKQVMSTYCSICGTKYYKSYSKYCHICGTLRT